MKTLHPLFRAAAAVCLVGLFVALAPSQASAGWRRRTVVVTTPAVYPAYVSPVTTVYSAPVTTTTVVSTPVPAVYTPPAVVANPVVPAAYVAPVAVERIRPRRVVYPRTVYVYPY